MTLLLPTRTLIFALALLLTAALSLLPSTATAANYATRDDVREFIADMTTRHGFDKDELVRLFVATRPVPAVIKLIMPPKDPKIRSWQTYRSRFVEPKRIAAGRVFMEKNSKALARAEEQFGVPAEVIASIIGVETIYGKHMGRFGTFAALTTLAFDYPPRADLFRKELEHLLLLAREEKRKVGDYQGSYAGALGLPQFLPSSIRAYATDFDENGHIELSTSPTDAIGSVARFLSMHGWANGETIAVMVNVEGEGIARLLAEGILPRRTPTEMQATGVTLAKVGAGDTAVDSAAVVPERPAALIELVTPDQPTEYRLGYQNFYVITRYNRSSFYAAAVMDLAGALRASK